ncbi:MBL fold metallo-hydrolase [Desulfopila inferna]|uniref:MBL fold metallo-hydrolase n=1 Tax=Desulfopila inferna TaxID=468528 RepID=UPI00196254A7|nr:MBL fold metallo-hydrolase [Desulfopila inferna]MBM9603551.1 MBL fold metallo-hydrolase [Desulfopila inferna]
MIRFPVMIAALTSAFLISSCFLKPPSFNEQKWLETVENTDIKDLYAQNFRDGAFTNPWLVQKERSFADFLRWRFTKSPSYSEKAEDNKPKIIPDLMERIEALDPAENFLVWIGHATFLFRIQGEYWLTDPIFTERALIPKRIIPPAIRADDISHLRPLHILLSHNHYDHLDKASLRDLPVHASFHVPKGLGEYVASLVKGPVSEMNWWDEKKMDSGATITCLPAQHWSRRLFQGYNTTLWASYMVSYAGKNIYFGGDSGYFKGYREIGNLFDNIDFALLPITAYEPRWFMHYPHIDTREAIRAFEDLGAEYFIPTQWGTFKLGDNPPGLPPLDLRRNIDEMQLNPERFLILDIGSLHRF